MKPRINSVPINDLARGISRDQPQLEEAFTKVLRSGYVVMGPQHAAFEGELADYLDVRFAMGVASGTDALELAIKAVMPVGKKTVLTAANAGGYTSIAARRAGFELAFADVDPETLCIALPNVVDALTPDVGVVVVTHLYGHFTDIRGLVDHCHARGVKVVEDCAQAIGARRPEGAAGTIGDIGTISFYPTKNLGAIGDGGAVITSDPELDLKIRQLRQYGWESKYNIATSGGVNSRLDEVQAAILRVRLPLLDSFNDRRREIISEYVTASANSPLKMLRADGVHHAAHLAVCIVEDRAEARAHFASLNVQTDVHFPTPDYGQLGLQASRNSLPNTEYAVNHVLTLPCFPELTDEEVEFVCAAIHNMPTD